MQYVIHSPQSPIECYMSLDAVTDPASAFAELTGSGEFYGEVTKESFTVRPHSTHTRAMRKPIIKGKFLPTEKGTDILIDLDVSLSTKHFIPLLVIVCVLAFSGAIAIGCDVLNAEFEKFVSDAVAVAVLCAAGIGFMYFGHIRPIKRSMKVLNEIFK